MNEDLIFFGGMAFFSAVAVAVVLGLGNWASSVSCEQQWRDSGMTSQYGFFSGCRVKADGKWIPADAFRELDK